MKLILINIIIKASWLLIIVASLEYFPRQGTKSVDFSPRQVSQRDELPYQPFIPLFRGYSSKDRFYHAVRNYPENSEYQGHPERPEYQGRPEYSEHHSKGPCSGTKRVVKEAMKFCSHVMKRLKKLKENLMGCDKVETPVGTLCEKDHKCYVVSEYYDIAENMMYAAYQKACPCPQKHFTTGAYDLGDPEDEESNENVLDFLMCLGQTDPDGVNEVVLTVEPNSNTCTSLSYGDGSDAYYVASHDCTPIMDIDPPVKFLFVCEVPCSSPPS